MLAAPWWRRLATAVFHVVAAASAAAAEDATAQAREPERLRLVQAGQVHLARGEAAEARAAFDGASGIRHAADAELGVVRAQMQAGQYRQALMSASHAAAHADHPEAAQLYAWLLTAGGQAEAARRMVVLPPGAGSDASVPGPAAVPADLVPTQASGAGTGLLINGGTLALAPVSAVQGAQALWLRNGLGRTVAARVTRGDCAGGLALLALDAPLPPASALPVRPHPAFAGSAATVVGYAAQVDAAPQWPVLRAGFLQRLPLVDGLPGLGVEQAPTRRDGVVLDAAGQLIGLALASDGTRSRLVSIAGLAACANVELDAAAVATAAAAVPLDAVYELALQVVVQVLRVP